MNQQMPPLIQAAILFFVFGGIFIFIALLFVLTFFATKQ